MALIQDASDLTILGGHRYVLVTPVRDEEQYIGAMIDSILAQEVLPSRWIIVDDGSSDRTPEIVSSYARQTGIIELIRLPARQNRQAGGESAITVALEQLGFSDYDYLGRFDADLVFEPDYIAQVLSEFERDPELGIAGGGLYIDKHGRKTLERVPDYHVRGAVKMYRRECFQHIGGLRTHIGWDTIDEVYAWCRGWKTRSFFQYRVYHRRPTGGRVGASLIYWARGKAEYYTWSDPVFALAKTIKIAITEFPGPQALAFLAGFLSCYLRNEDRLQDSTFVYTRRHQQRRRMSRLLARSMGITALTARKDPSA
jgi:biofilm PGA synthesis N-glycosyltransferase PgaC